MDQSGDILVAALRAAGGNRRDCPLGAGGAREPAPFRVPEAELAGRRRIAGKQCEDDRAAAGWPAAAGYLLRAVYLRWLAF